MGELASQALRRVAPIATTAQAVTGSSTPAISIASLKRQIVRFWAVSATVYVKFGASTLGAATTDDLPILPGDYVDLYILDEATHFRAVGSGAGNLVFAVVSP